MSPTRPCTAASLGRRVLLLAAALLIASPAKAQDVRILSDANGTHLQVNGQPFMIRGMNWDYIPIGQNYAFNLWAQPDAIIKTALEREMSLLKQMGVNAIRVYAGIPPRWVRYIYETYGIFTVVNHSLGRYGVTVNGVYVPSTDYSNPRVRQILLAEVTALADEFRGTPGLLMWLLGNENNYGLTWKSAETEALPVGERDVAKARHLYSLFGEAARAMKARDGGHLVAMANGDLQYIDLIAQHSKGIDVFGSNVYRGRSFRDFFATVKDKLGVPVMFTEFGADAYNARTMREDQLSQARYVLAQWQEIYEQSSGKGGVGNAIGGFTFQWSDGWWKTGQETELDIHNTAASWPADAYQDDFVPGENNMNEEWWGIAAKGPVDRRGLFPLYPRAAYYALQQFYQIDAYAPTTTRAAIAAHAAAIDLPAAAARARATRVALGGIDESRRLRLGSMRLSLATFNTGGTRLATPDADARTNTSFPSFTGFDHLESFYGDVIVRPLPNIVATASVNVLGNVPGNPIDEIYYENRGRTRAEPVSGGGTRTINGTERVKLYRAGLSWDSRQFALTGFYRTGHYHWGYEGDFFGLYREANYGPNIDTYNGAAPLGVEIVGKRALSGLKVAVGPSLWWGANPAVLVKYRRSVRGIDVTGVFQDDYATQGAIGSSFAIPVPPTQTATIALATTRGGLGLEVGGLWSGANKVGRPFQMLAGSPGSYRVLQDRILESDAFGAKGKVTYTKGRWNWYAQGAAMGLVAEGGPTATQTFSGFGLKDSGSGNQVNVIAGLSVAFGDFAIAPNFLWQQPLVGPMPAYAPAPGRPRNILDDPFAVRANRETTAGELLLTYDPTPATWMYQWDNDEREDARFAANVGYTYKHFPTTRDASIGILGDGRTAFAFPGATPPRDLWEVRGKVVAVPMAGLRLIANGYVGTGEPNGDNARLVHRAGADLRVVRKQIKVMAAAKLNDWGPYDYHRDFNLTYPRQLIGDLSYFLGTPRWFDVPESRFGVRATWRTLDRLSPRYCPVRTRNALGAMACDATGAGDDGREWEVRSYVMIGW
jgi:hypothetical protein